MARFQTLQPVARLSDRPGEAVSRPESRGPAAPRQGRGEYMRKAGIAPLAFHVQCAVSKQAVAQTAAVCRALEAEYAAPAGRRPWVR